MSNTAYATPASINGVDVATLFATLDAVKGQNEIAKFQFRAENTWQTGTHSQSRIHGFYGAGQELTHTHETVLDADHPVVLTGADNAPTPVEYLLHALAACLTAGIANIASARGVTLTKVTSTVEGDIDLLGILGLSDGSVRNGYQGIRVDVPHRGRRRRRDPARHRRAVAPPLRRLRRPHQPHTRLRLRRDRLSETRRVPVRRSRTGRTRRSNTMPAIDTVVIGAGHAGLAVSRLLTLEGRDHVVLDRGRVAESWRTARWDSLHLLTPNWMARLPEWAHTGPDADGFMSASQFVRYLEGYAASFSAPGPGRCARGGGERSAVTATASSPTARPGWLATSSSRPDPAANRGSRRPWRASALTST